MLQRLQESWCGSAHPGRHKDTLEGVEVVVVGVDVARQLEDELKARQVARRCPD